ncbi:hypothetical protein NDU88_002918 [Pleurodeles waltl]|uniref:Uncharacterized protein n=1 Tax=Pleurodeles waltl TaxID=8319 RepID=A0AAV7TN06_PLEWA|nr:hypothetical protein NDU88_002918 [Pleurodeles waltl]
MQPARSSGHISQGSEVRTQSSPASVTSHTHSWPVPAATPDPIVGHGLQLPGRPLLHVSLPHHRAVRPGNGSTHDVLRHQGVASRPK